MKAGATVRPSKMKTRKALKLCRRGFERYKALQRLLKNEAENFLGTAAACCACIKGRLTPQWTWQQDKDVDSREGKASFQIGHWEEIRSSISGSGAWFDARLKVSQCFEDI